METEFRRSYKFAKLQLLLNCLLFRQEIAQPQIMQRLYRNGGSGVMAP